MAFESVVAGVKRARIDGPYLRLSWSSRGVGRGYLSSKIETPDRAIWLEVDTKTQRVRVKPAEYGPEAIRLCGNKNRTFSICKSVMRQIDFDGAIPLELGPDGWYYGKYGEGVE